MNELIDEGLHNIRELLGAKRRRKNIDPGDFKMTYIKELVGLLEYFNREVLSVEKGSIVISLLCCNRYSVWDLRSLCRSDGFIEVCRLALIPVDLQSELDVEVTVDQSTVKRCVETLDEIDPQPPSPLGDGDPGLQGQARLPPEMLHLILHKVFSAREMGIEVKTGDIASVCQKWKIIVADDRFNRDHRCFIEGSMRPYLLNAVELKTKISSDNSKPIIGVSILVRHLYVAHAEGLSIDVFSIPDISKSNDLSITSIPDHQLIKRLNVPEIQMPFNMTSSQKSNCLYLTDFSSNIGCVWKVSPDGVVRKFTDSVGRPTGINVSRDDYVIVVAEEPDNVLVYSRFGDQVLKIPLSAEVRDPRQAICTGPGRFALIHGYRDPANRVVVLDEFGHVLRCYGNVAGAGYTQIHWPAGLICDSRGRMLVADRENRRVHLLQRNFRLRRHLLQLDVNTVSRPRRLCIDDYNGTLYVGHTDSTIKVFRVAYPFNDRGYGEEQVRAAEVDQVNCFGTPKKKVPVQPVETATADISKEEAIRRRLNRQLPLGPIENLNELPTELLQMIILKATAMEQKIPFHKTLINVCRSWYNIAAVMHFRYRLRQLIRGRREAAKRRQLEALQESPSP